MYLVEPKSSSTEDPRTKMATKIAEDPRTKMVTKIAEDPRTKIATKIAEDPTTKNGKTEDTTIVGAASTTIITEVTATGK